MADAVHGRVEIKFCQPCLRKDTRNEADIYCKDCGEYQCKECENVHQLFPVTSKHKMVNANEAFEVGLKYDMKGLDHCKEHHKLLEFFCEDEMIPCCGKCIIVSHRSCRSVVDVEEMATRKTIDFSDIQQELVNIEEIATGVVLHIENARDTFSKDLTKMANDIQVMQDKVNGIFENLTQTVVKDVAVFQKQVFVDFDTKKAACDKYISDVKQISAEIQAISEQGNPIQQLIVAAQFKSQVTQLKRKTENVSTDLRDVVLKFDFADSLKLRTIQNSTPGNLILRYEKTHKVSDDTVFGPNNVQKVSLKLLTSVDLKQRQGDKEEPLFSGFDFLPDGRIVAVDNQNQKCLVFSSSLKELNSFQLSQTPQDVVVLSEKEVAVTTGINRTILLIQISKFNEIRAVCECQVSHDFESICLLDDVSLLVGSNEDIQPVRALSLKGEERELGMQFHSKIYPFNTCNVAYIRSRKIVVLSDRLVNTVYIYDTASGRKVKVKDEKLIKTPRGVAVGPNDCIFVCSEDTHSVVQISHTGQILSSYLLDMRFPGCVRISKDKKRIAVSNSVNGCNKLQLYGVDTM